MEKKPAFENRWAHVRTYIRSRVTSIRRRRTLISPLRLPSNLPSQKSRGCGHLDLEAVLDHWLGYDQVAAHDCLQAIPV